MRFKRSGFRPYDRGGVISVNSRTPPRRLWRLRPRLALLALGLAIVAGFAVDRAWIRGNGIVAGELTAVAPIVQARLQHLTVRCELDTGQYLKGIVVSDAEMAALNIKPAEFHGEWNYTISPNADPPNCALIS